MKSIIILLLFLSVASSGYSQGLLNSKVRLDTIFYLSSFENDVSGTEPFVLNKYCFDKYLYFFSPKLKTVLHSDSLFFTEFNVLTGESKDFFVITPELNLRTNYPDNISSLCLDDTFLHIGYSDNLFVSFIKKNKSYNFYFFDPLKAWHEEIFCYNKSLFLFNSYRTIDLKSNWNYIYKYDTDKHFFSAAVNFDFKHPEFSYFRPNKWFDFYKGQSAMSQTISYEISLYDSALNLKKTLSRNDVSGWVDFKPTPMLDTVLAIKDRGGNISVVMSCLVKHLPNIARVERVYFINESSLMVIYYVPSEQKSLNNTSMVLRKVDIWDLNKYELIHKDMDYKEGVQEDDGSDFNHDEIISKDNFPLFFDGSEIFFLKEHKKMVVIRSGGKFKNYLNIPFEDLTIQEDKYLDENDPVLQVFVYSLNL